MAPAAAGVAGGRAGDASAAPIGTLVVAAPSRGAMIAFSTLAEPQTGQATSPRFACLSKAAEFWNQLSNSWPLVAVERVADHSAPRTACRWAGSAIGSIIFEPAAVLERGNARARRRDRGRIDVGA